MQTLDHTKPAHPQKPDQHTFGVVHGGPSSVDGLKQLRDAPVHPSDFRVQLNFNDMTVLETKTLPSLSARRSWLDDVEFPPDRERMLLELENLFATRFPIGTPVVISLVTFEFVSAATRTKALKAFVERFGPSEPGWAFDVGRPIAVGGGACPT